ncbi:hypothetical protein SAMN02745146_2072 [Hymenobacter daecheongensis DSM 21074]|uniref:Uncharacterized protein n=1 Tax=Hymenobacter daecheongensis DSM 21074 TaxID=1121955 RepID=A0A1M6G0Y2_9BACT|nr:hypothetical protein [Hymenobacter daecheongensis]SHJ03635.1 hypothetical protein SAMN02745146_2072 [Hymenobacter daecheongensis DSM 21074]
MNTNTYSRTSLTAVPPVILGVDLTIANQESVRRSLRSAFGLSARAINLRIDPSMELIYLCETTLPNTLPCLATLTGPGVTAVTLRTARLEWQPDADHAIGRGTSTLAALETGTCFLTASSRKIAVASFTSPMVHATHIDMDVLGHPNLLEYLRTEWFTLELSGTNRRRLSRPLAFKTVLEFDVQMARAAQA